MAGAWVLGGYWYVTYYAPEKAIILKGPWPFAHNLFMETKEHLFFIPLILALYLPIVARLDLSRNRSARLMTMAVAALVVVNGLAIGHAASTINYAAARRSAKPISTATTESAVQRLIHRWMTGKQQMRWSPQGAHLMLKVAEGQCRADANCACRVALWMENFAVPDRYCRLNRELLARKFSLLPPLLSGQTANRFNWLASVASTDRAASGKSADRINSFSNTVTEKTCNNV